MALHRCVTLLLTVALLTYSATAQEGPQIKAPLGLLSLDPATRTRSFDSTTGIQSTNHITTTMNDIGYGMETANIISEKDDITIQPYDIITDISTASAIGYAGTSDLFTPRIQSISSNTTDENQNGTNSRNVTEKDTDVVKEPVNGEFTTESGAITFDSTTRPSDHNTGKGNVTISQLYNDHEWIQQESQKFTLYWAGWYIHLIWLPIIVPIGIAGNLMSFIIMMQKENQHISCCLYMPALAITDSVALFRKGYEWLIYMFGKPYAQTECQILAYLGLSSIQYGMFLIIAMTFDRVLMIKFPLKAHIYCSTVRAKVTICVLLVIACLYNIPHFVMSRHLGNPPYTCSSYTVPIPYMDVYAWVSSVINFLAPFVGLIIMNVIIIKTIHKRAKNLNISNENISKSMANSDERQLSIMLTLVGVFFVILNLPQCIRILMVYFLDRWSSPYNHAIFIFVFHFANKTYYTNNGINFFLYCIGGSKFRQSLRKLCCCCVIVVRRRDGPPVISSIAMNTV